MAEESRLALFKGRPGRRLRLSIQRAGFSVMLGRPHRGLVGLLWMNAGNARRRERSIYPDLFGRECARNKVFVLDTFS